MNDLISYYIKRKALTIKTRAPMASWFGFTAQSICHIFATIPVYQIARRAALVLLVMLAITHYSYGQSRIKDLVSVEGVRENILVGYGLVVGLNGTGDDLNTAIFTQESVIGMLARLGINAQNANLETDNIAAVLVTGSLPPFAAQGSQIDVNISSLGGASSLQGGTLIVTPLIGADGEVYAVAQGSVSVGGFTVQGQAQTITRGVPTSGRIPNGGIVEREITYDFSNQKSLRLSLRNPDFTTARRIKGAINGFIGEAIAETLNSATVEISRPSYYDGGIISLITDIEQLRIEPDDPAKVIIDESTGIIVIGNNVRISKVAIAQGNLTVRVTENQQVSQPQPFAQQGTTQTTNNTDVAVNDGEARQLAVVDNGVNLEQLVNGLNALGVGPRDMISILQGIKAAGALHGQIEAM